MKPVEVAENLWCGGHPFRGGFALGSYDTIEYDVIVNLSFRESVKPNQRQLVIWSPIRDNSELPPTIPMLAECILALIDAERKVLVHCDQGLNRAPFICALVIGSYWSGDEENNAMTYVRSQIPGSLTNPVFVNYLRNEVKV